MRIEVFFDQMGIVHSRPAAYMGIRRVGPKPSPLHLLATGPTPIPMEISPTTMTMDQHKASAAVFPAVVTAPAAKPGWRYGHDGPDPVLQE